MASVNKVILVGNLGRDPEVRYMPNGEAACNFSIATTDSWKDKQGQKQEKTEWHAITLFGKLGEIAGEYLKKGSSVYIEGRIQTETWKDKETGADRSRQTIRGDRMQMLGGKGDAGAGDQDQPDTNTSTQKINQPQAHSNGQNASNFDNFEDDIPF